jgi:hypothetical protein
MENSHYQLTRLTSHSLNLQNQFSNEPYKKKIVLLACALLLAACSFAQTSNPQPEPDVAAQQTPPSPETSSIGSITIPADTRIPMVLTHPIQSRYIHHGDEIYAQITSPVTAGNEVIIPPGSFVQGKVDKLEKKGSRGMLHLQSASVTLPNGFVALVSGPITLRSDDGYAIKDPGKGRIVGTFIAPMAGLGLGTLIGRAASSSQPTTLTSSLPPDCGIPTIGCTDGISTSLTVPANHMKGIAIGSTVGMAVGALISISLLYGSHNFYLDQGSPVEMTLQKPLVIQQNQGTSFSQQ